MGDSCISAHESTVGLSGIWVPTTVADIEQGLDFDLLIITGEKLQQGSNFATSSPSGQPTDSWLGISKVNQSSREWVEKEVPWHSRSDLHL